MADSSNPINLPLRRREQLRRVLSGEPVGKSSIAVGYKNEESGRTALYNTRKRLTSTMEVFGLTDAALVRDYLIPLMNATKVEYYAKDGIVTDERIVEDNGTRKDTLRMAFQLKGAFPKEQGDGPSHLNITIANTIDVNKTEDRDE